MPTRTLSFDTTARAISVALFSDHELIDERKCDWVAGASSRLLAPQIKELMDRAGWQLAQLDQIVLPIGPGSFSGLRMGVVTAKMLAWSLEIPVFGLNSLEVIAYRSRELPEANRPDRVVAVLDAQRGELFAQEFCFEPTGLPKSLAARSIVATSQLLAQFPQGRYSGPGLKIASRRQPNETAPLDLEDLARRSLPTEVWECGASSAARLAIARGATLAPIDCWALAPDYGRPSAAEEKAIERHLT